MNITVAERRRVAVETQNETLTVMVSRRIHWVDIGLALFIFLFWIPFAQLPIFVLLVALIQETWQGRLMEIVRLLELTFSIESLIRIAIVLLTLLTVTAMTTSFVMSTLWRLFGKEKIVFSSRGVSASCTLAGVGFSETYNLDTIKYMHAAAPTNQAEWLQQAHSSYWWRFLLFAFGGAIVINHGAKERRIANGLEYAQAKEVLAEAVKLLPFSNKVVVR